MTKPSFNFKLPILLGIAALLPVMAQAHPGHGPAGGFASGFDHPLHGFDHILAMVAVGLWAAQMGGKSLWMVPAAFVSLMTVGGALGMAGRTLGKPMGVPVPRRIPDRTSGR